MYKFMLCLNQNGDKKAWEKAAISLKSFHDRVKDDERFEILIGINTSDSIETMHKIAIPILAGSGLSGTYWSEDKDVEFFNKWGVKHPKPFYEKFSYGKLVNHMLLMAKSKNCRYMVRIDPGVEAPDDIKEVLKNLFDQLQNSELKAVSVQYKGRLAIRDEFIYRNNKIKNDYYSFVSKYTGINVINQVTGGALFTVDLNKEPFFAIPFDNLAVWGSDDGFFQNQKIAEVVKINGKNVEVPRFDLVGSSVPLQKYYQRVACMVYLNYLLIMEQDGKDVEEARKDAEEVTEDFIKKIENCIDSNLVEGGQYKLAVPGKGDFETIEKGLKNYEDLGKNVECYWCKAVEIVNKVNILENF